MRFLIWIDQNFLWHYRQPTAEQAKAIEVRSSSGQNLLA